MTDRIDSHRQVIQMATASHESHLAWATQKWALVNKTTHRCKVGLSTETQSHYCSQLVVENWWMKLFVWTTTGVVMRKYIEPMKLFGSPHKRIVGRQRARARQDCVTVELQFEIKGACHEREKQSGNTECLASSPPPPTTPIHLAVAVDWQATKTPRWRPNNTNRVWSSQNGTRRPRTARHFSRCRPATLSQCEWRERASGCVYTTHTDTHTHTQTYTPKRADRQNRADTRREPSQKEKKSLSAAALHTPGR